MKKIIYVLLLIVLIVHYAFSAFAHSGKTDSSGGHYDRDAGEYHYHHGYPAHQHPNGECPYDFKDKTKHTERSYNSYTSKATTTSTTKKPLTKEEKLEKNNKRLLIVTIVVSALFVIEIFVCVKVKKRDYEKIDLLLNENKIITAEREKEIAEHKKISSEHNETISELRYDLGINQRRIIEYNNTILDLRDKIEDLSNKNDIYIGFLLEQYNFKNIHEIFPLIPADTYFLPSPKKYLPYDSKPGKYGSYTMYRTRSGYSYHFIKGCSGAYKEVNFMEIDPEFAHYCMKCSIFKNSEMEYCDLWRYDFETFMRAVDDMSITIDLSGKSGPSSRYISDGRKNKN